MAERMEGYGSPEREIEALRTEIALLNGSLERAMDEREQNLDMAQRVQAEFMNFKRRTEENNKRVYESGVADAVMKVLDVYDVVKQASSMIQDSNTNRGLKMILEQVKKSLGELDIREMNALGKMFDPKYHDVIMRETAQENETLGEVTEVFSEGFMMGDKVLRHATVKIAD